MNKTEIKNIENCLNQIEDKLKWGSSDNWKQRDFEALSDLIYEKTKTQLSLSTLKRIWEKNFKNMPQQNTLNALVQFLDFTNWQEFKTIHAKTTNSTESIIEKQESQLARNKRIVMLFMFFVIVCIAAFLGARKMKSTHKEKPESFDSKEIEFSSTSVSDNIPNTVLFKYKLPKLKTDSIFIQQNWDSRRRQKVSADDSVHTSIYYYPGYFNTKLVIKDSIVKEKPLHIKTDGWQTIATETGMDEIPSYIPQEYTQSNGVLYVSPSTLKDYNVDLKAISHWVHFINSNEFGNLNCNNFVLETSVKNALADGALTCQEAYIQIHFESGFAMIPFAIPGCVSNLRLKYCDYSENGKKNDLSMFGCEMDQWQKVLIEANNGKVKIFLNDKQIKSFSFTHNNGKIKYIQYRFKGCGMVDYIRLSDINGEMVYEDDFNI